MDVSSAGGYLHIGVCGATDNLLVGFLLGVRFHEALSFIEVVLGPHASLGLGTVLSMQLVTTALVVWPAGRGSPTIRSLISMTKIVEVVKHQVHILLLLTLKVMDDALVLVHLDSDVRVSLSGDCSRLDEVASLLIHVVAALGC